MQTLYSVHVNYLVRTFFTLLCPHDWRILFNYMGNYLHLYNFNMYVSFVQTFMDPTPAVMRGLISHLRHSSEILGIRSNYQLDNTLNNMTIIFIFVFWTSFSLGMGYCLS